MHCNGASHDGVAESGLHVRQDSQDNCKGWNEGALGGHLSESGVEEEPQHESGQHQTERNSSPSYANPKRGEGNCERAREENAFLHSPTTQLF
jgi:hypothetical protein